MKTKTSKRLIFSMLILTTFSLSACGSQYIFRNSVQNAVQDSTTMMEFSFNSDSYADHSDEKAIYINNDMEKLNLNAELRLDSGEITVQVINVLENKEIWSESRSEDSSFAIEFVDLKAGEYLLKVNAEQSKEAVLIITSDEKLVQDREKPEKYNVDKK